MNTDAIKRRLERLEAAALAQIVPEMTDAERVVHLERMFAEGRLAWEGGRVTAPTREKHPAEIAELLNRGLDRKGANDPAPVLPSA